MFSHPAFLYRGQDEFLAGTVGFARAGLDAGEAVAVAAPPEHLDWLRPELGDEVSYFDMTEKGRNPGHIIPGVLRAFADRHEGPVRIIGEPIWEDRTEVEYPACVQHEALINLAFAGRDLSILCPYDAKGLDSAILEDAARTHPIMEDTQGQWISHAYAPDQVLEQYNAPLPPPAETPWVLSFDRAGLSGARRFATERGAAYGLDEDQATDLCLIVGELCANSLRHGTGTGVVRIWRENGHLVCEVADGGHITDPLAGRRPADTRQLNGRGLLMVNYLADLVRLHTAETGTQTRAHLRLR